MSTTTHQASGSAPSALSRHLVRAQPIVDVIAYVVLMFLTALAISVVFGGLVLLLASPARAAGDDEVAYHGEVQRGTLLLRGEAQAGFAAPVLRTEVSIHVSGPIAHTHVTQTFRNPSARWFEGVYVFPLPENAAVSGMRLRIGERVIEGEVQERSRARAAYQQAKVSGQRAALVEQERPNLFTTSVANIGPQQQIVIELEYRQTLDYQLVDGVGRYSLRFPLVAGPRYLPAGQVVDAERISSPVAPDGERLLNPVSIHVKLDAGVPIEHVDSPFHAVHVIRAGDTRRTVTLANGDTPANRDFELTWTLTPGAQPTPSLFVEPGKGGASYALLTLMPPAPTAGAELIAREVIFVIDTSGSMEGESIVQAREALTLALRRLRPADRFNVIAFNHASTPLFAGAEPASVGNLGHAVRWVRRLEANGGTEMAGALELALRAGDSGGRVRQVIFLTDGAVGNEQQLFSLIERHLGASRLFTVGIGSAPNSFFMRKAAQSGRGTFTYIGKVGEVQHKMSELFARLESPVVKNIRLGWPDGREVESWPAQVPDLYLGEPLVVAARLDMSAGEITIRGEAGTEPWTRSVSLADAQPGSGIASLWARRKIDALMDGLSLGADEAVVRAEVIPLAIDHQLASRFTSFVAVDRTPARPAGIALDSAALATNLPAGWDHAAIFGELPRGATDARWHLLIGFVALSFGLVLRRLVRKPLSPAR